MRKKRRITHMLKSSTAMLGAKKLTDTLKEIDQQIQLKEYDDIYLKCQSLPSKFEVTSVLLQKYS